MSSYREIYDLYWKDFIENDNGDMVQERVKRELADYHSILKELKNILNVVVCPKCGL